MSYLINDIIEKLKNEFKNVIKFLEDRLEINEMQLKKFWFSKNDLMYHIEYNGNHLRDSASSFLENEFKFGSGDDISESSCSMVGVGNFNFGKKYTTPIKIANNVKFNVNGSLSTNKDQHK